MSESNATVEESNERPEPKDAITNFQAKKRYQEAIDKRRDHIKHEESFFDTQEFEELEKEFAEETLGEEKDQIDTKDIQPLVVENPNDQNQEASNINVVSEVKTIKIEIFFV